MDNDCVVVATVEAGAAASTCLRIDDVLVLPFATDRVAGTLQSAKGASVAGISDLVGDQCLAYRCGATMVSDVSEILISEVAEGSEHRIGRGLSQSA